MIMRAAFTIFLLLLIIHLGYGRFIGDDMNYLVSDGLELKSQILGATTVTCEPTYGFLPCTTQLWGQVFLIVVYQFLLSLGESYISAGSDLFFQLTGPGIFGASLFHLLPTIPQISLVLASGLSSSIAEAEVQAAMGINLLAGSAVMNLTLVWGTCVFLGSYDLSKPSTSSTLEHNKPTGFGVRTDNATKDTAKIMILSLVPFLIFQLSKVIDSSTWRRVTILVALIVTLAFLVAYSSYQIFRPWIQNRQFEYLTQKFVKNKLLKLLSQNGKPNVALIKEIFKEIDKNNDKAISRTELRVLVLGIQLEGGGDIRDDYAKRVMDEMDISGDARIDEAEFVRVLLKWLTEARESISDDDRKFLSRNESTKEEHQSLLARKKKGISADRSWLNYAKAAFQLLLGTAMLALLARPLINSVVNFSTAANIPSFLIPYVVIPLAITYGRAKSAIASARRRTAKSASLTLSQIYGSVFMSNMVGLTVFLLLVYIRDLSCDVSAEVLVVLIIITLMGLFTSFIKEFPVWTSYLAYLLYPISLLLLYVLTVVVGWT